MMIVQWQIQPNNLNQIYSGNEKFLLNDDGALAKKNNSNQIYSGNGNIPIE